MLIDRFLEDATEVDVDAIRDHTGEVLIGGVMEHVEEAGVHSRRLGVRDPAADAAAVGRRGHRGVHDGDRQRLDVRGLINVQYAVVGTTVYVIEANPRASRTVPSRGVEFNEPPNQMPYGIDSGFRDPSGNSVRLTQLAQGWPDT